MCAFGLPIPVFAPLVSPTSPFSCSSNSRLQLVQDPTSPANPQRAETPGLGQRRYSKLSLQKALWLRDRKEEGIGSEKMPTKAKWNEEPHTFQKGGF